MYQHLLRRPRYCIVLTLRTMSLLLLQELRYSSDHLPPGLNSDLAPDSALLEQQIRATPSQFSGLHPVVVISTVATSGKLLTTAATDPAATALHMVDSSSPDPALVTGQR
jgi:hypothetical protein